MIMGCCGVSFYFCFFVRENSARGINVKKKDVLSVIDSLEKINSVIARKLDSNVLVETEVLAAVGSIPLGFTSAKYSRSDLNRMNGELLTLLDGKGIFATWGIYDDQNRIVLDVQEPLPDDLLAAIAEIDPDDDAILIRVVEERTLVTEQLMKGPAPIGEGVDAPDPGGVTVPDVDTVDPEEGENPTVHFATDPGTVAPDDEDLEAIEPYYDGGVSDLPQQKLPGKVESAHHDLLPVE